MWAPLHANPYARRASTTSPRPPLAARRLCTPLLPARSYVCDPMSLVNTSAEKNRLPVSGTMLGPLLEGRTQPPRAVGLYDPRNEKDSCGIGFIADLTRAVSRSTVTVRELMQANLCTGSSPDTLCDARPPFSLCVCVWCVMCRMRWRCSRAWSTAAPVAAKSRPATAQARSSHCRTLS